ncbi:MAG: TetR family transcriptional regulator [Solirubrobacteraceae bacterium]
MEEEPRRLRADAERNRRLLLDAATEMFCERGLDVGVGEIAQRAGVGRGTLFRNFPSKEHLIAAIVVEGMSESAARGRAALEAPDPGEALFALIDQSVDRSLADRAMFEALDDVWLANEEIRAAHAELMSVLDQLVVRAQEAGAVRADVGAVDVLMMIKGVCEAASSFADIDPEIAMRQLDLVRAAISPQEGQRPLRGRRPAIDELKPVVPKAPAPAVASEPAVASARAVASAPAVGEAPAPARAS